MLQFNVIVLTALTLLVATPYAQSTAKPAAKTAGAAGIAGSGDAAKCDCAIFPWTPDACVKTCAGRFLNLPLTTLDKYLQTDDYKASVQTIKKQGLTPGEVEQFLAKPEGKMFLQSVGKAGPDGVKVLALEASKAPVTKGR